MASERYLQDLRLRIPEVHLDLQNGRFVFQRVRGQVLDSDRRSGIFDLLPEEHIPFDVEAGEYKESALTVFLP